MKQNNSYVKFLVAPVIENPIFFNCWMEASSMATLQLSVNMELG